MSRQYPDFDPRGLIHEAYLMHPTPSECRAIFLDWALGDLQGDPVAAIQTLLALFAPDHPDHPMTQVLREGLAPSPTPKRQRRRTKARDG